MLRPCVVFVLLITLSGCAQHDDIVFAEDATGGDVNRGERFIYSYNCGSCHRIPGIPEARGTVGPPLGEFANRVYISGSLENTPANLIAWIKDPQQIEPRTAMPKLGVTEEQALDIATYLYTLR